MTKDEIQKLYDANLARLRGLECVDKDHPEARQQRVHSRSVGSRAGKPAEWYQQQAEMGTRSDVCAFYQNERAPLLEKQLREMPFFERAALVKYDEDDNLIKPDISAGEAAAIQAMQHEHDKQTWAIADKAYAEAMADKGAAQ